MCDDIIIYWSGIYPVCFNFNDVNIIFCWIGGGLLFMKPLHHKTLLEQQNAENKGYPMPEIKYPRVFTLGEILSSPCTGNAMLLFLIVINMAWHYEDQLKYIYIPFDWSIFWGVVFGAMLTVYICWLWYTLFGTDIPSVKFE